MAAADDPAAKDEGLSRLKEAIQKAPGIYPRSAEKPEGRSRRVNLCLLIEPGDTYETIAARHPELGNPRKVRAALWTIRTQVMAGQFPRIRRYPPYEIAQAYLNGLPPHYRLPSDD